MANTLTQLIEDLKVDGVLKTPRIIRAFLAINRRDFVRDEDKARAYVDAPLPIGCGQTVSQPYTVAFMLELLQPKPGERILDIGCGSGWTTALLASLVGLRSKVRSSKLKVSERRKGAVYAIERITELCEWGRGNVEKYFDAGVEFWCGDGSNGWPYAGKNFFDKILVSAALYRRTIQMPDAWVTQLKTGGQIVVPIDGSIWRFEKESSGLVSEEFPGFSFVPLITT